MPENPDFGGLAGLNLPKEIINSIKQARIEARSAIESIEPLHITSWADLIAKLRIALENAERNENTYRHPASPKPSQAER